MHDMSSEAKKNSTVRPFLDKQFQEITRLSANFTALQKSNMKVSTESASKDSGYMHESSECQWL